MKMNRVAGAGAVILVLLGCVLAAGCLSVPDEPIVGSWKIQYGTFGVDFDVIENILTNAGSPLAKYVPDPEDAFDILDDLAYVQIDLNADGTGELTAIIRGEKVRDGSVSWMKSGTDRYKLTYGDYQVEYFYSPENQTLAEEDHLIVLEKMT